MSCFAPLRAYRSLERGESGKRALVFSYREGFHDRPVEIPCGQCLGCREERSRQWAMRCMHEATLHKHNIFVTLTYSDEHLPEHGSLKKRDFQLFMKKLRKSIHPDKVRFFHSGEYGEKYLRPHYHALLFGYQFPDQVYHGQRNGNAIFRSKVLENLWGKGHCEIGSVTYQSASYVAKYCVKKLNGEEAHERYKRLDKDTGELVSVEAEYATQSRRPGIGRGFYEKFGEQVHRLDTVIFSGKEMKPPKYYDLLAEKIRPEELRLAKARRRAGIDPEEQSPDRLTQREICAQDRAYHLSNKGSF